MTKNQEVIIELSRRSVSRAIKEWAKSTEDDFYQKHKEYQIAMSRHLLTVTVWVADERKKLISK